MLSSAPQRTRRAWRQAPCPAGGHDVHLAARTWLMLWRGSQNGKRSDRRWNSSTPADHTSASQPPRPRTHSGALQGRDGQGGGSRQGGFSLVASQ